MLLTLYSGDKHPDKGAGISIMATGLWEAKAQTEEDTGARGTVLVIGGLREVFVETMS